MPLTDSRNGGLAMIHADHYAAAAIDRHLNRCEESERVAEALAADLDYWLPGWEDDERRHAGHLVSEDDFPVYDASADDSRVSVSDWETIAEDLFTDPAETGE